MEHARNAGPTLYYLHFSHDGALGVLPDEEPLAVSAALLRREPGTWLVEERLVLVDP